MNFIQEIISENLVYALGWTVVHSLWQAMLVAIGLAFAMLGLQKKSARLRYIVANAALLLVLFLAVFTFLDLYQFSGSHHAHEITRLTMGFSDPFVGSSTFLGQISHQFTHYFNVHLPLIVSVWLMGVAFFLLRLFGGLAYIQHLRNRYTRPLSDYWQMKLEDLAAHIPLHRKVELVESALVNVPMMIGYFKPLILLPVGTINALSEEEVEAILAHELAHIWRNDYLLNIMQSLIEVLFYFNPAVWWLSANIRTERENCCDDIAVEICGDSLAYAKALVSLQEMSVSTPSLAMTFSGRKNQLLKRVKRILNQPKNKSNIMEKLTATCLLLGAILVLSFNANSTPNYFGEELELEELLWEEHMEELEEEEALETITIYQLTDTLPKGKIRIETKKDGQNIDARVEDQKIKALKIDGEEIPESKFEEYEEMVEELLNDIPPPPPVPPAPPAPITPGTPPAPPAPPAPPSPSWKHKKETKVTREKGENGTTYLIIKTEDSDEPLEIKIDEEDGKVYLDGELIEDGETAYIVEEKDFGGNGYFVWPDVIQGKIEPHVYRLDNHKRWKEFKDLYSGELLEVAPFFPETFELQDNAAIKERFEEAQKLYEDAMERNSERIENWEGNYFEELKKLKKLKNLDFSYNYLLDTDHLFDTNIDVAPDGAFKVLPRGNFFYRNIRKAFEHQLLKDGLILDGDNYKLEFSGKAMKLNGEKMPETIFNKYKKIYESHTGTKLRKKSRLIMTD